jgi:uncharacterized membrane protein
MSDLLLYTTTRVLHIGAAIVLVGGTFFIRCVLAPAASRSLSDAEHQKLRSDLMQGWKRVIHGGIALLLLSGGINYYRVIAARTHKGDGLYHGLLGTKILLAMAIFFIASAIVGRSPRFEAMRKNIRKWMVVNLILAFLIISISGFLKVRGAPAAQEANPEKGEGKSEETQVRPAGEQRVRLALSYPARQSGWVG